MATLANAGIKIDGKWYNITISINDTVDQYGNNVSIFEQQTKEQREAKEKKNYVGNGKVTWTDGKIEKAPFVEKGEPKKEEDILPF